MITRDSILGVLKAFPSPTRVTWRDAFLTLSSKTAAKAFDVVQKTKSMILRNQCREMIFTIQCCCDPTGGHFQIPERWM